MKSILGPSNSLSLCTRGYLCLKSQNTNAFWVQVVFSFSATVLTFGVLCGCGQRGVCRCGDQVCWQTAPPGGRAVARKACCGTAGKPGVSGSWPCWPHRGAVQGAVRTLGKDVAYWRNKRRKKKNSLETGTTYIQRYCPCFFFLNYSYWSYYCRWCNERINKQRYKRWKRLLILDRWWVPWGVWSRILIKPSNSEVH